MKRALINGVTGQDGSFPAGVPDNTQGAPLERRT
jgi:hypothetical protein